MAQIGHELQKRLNAVFYVVAQRLDCMRNEAVIASLAASDLAFFLDDDGRQAADVIVSELIDRVKK